MNTSLIDQDVANQGIVDRVFIGWVFAWSFALSIVVVGNLSGHSVGNLSNENAVTLGFAMGGLSAVWSLIGTWIVLIDLPVTPVDRHGEEESGQRLRPRVPVLGFWLANIAIVSLCVYEQASALAQILLTVTTSILVAVVSLQWTNQRIHRNSVPSRKKKRSIRQILGVTTTIALMIATLKAGDELLQLSGALTAMVVSSAALWLVLLLTTLGRWWGIGLVTIPAVIVQWIVVSILMDLQSRTTETMIMRFSGGILGFYFFSLMFLMLMRSSGHRWIWSRSFSTTKA